jgi:chemotaxis family two-component system response regulator Rcp1
MAFDILLVEDSPGDVRLTNEAFSQINPAVRIWAAFDGAEAMAFLRHEREHEHAPRPDLILLDLNMPKMDGRQVLAQVKGDDDLMSIPTIILTTSRARDDIDKCYLFNANCYLNKPVQLEDFEDLVRTINDFWLLRATLPGHAEAA